VRKEKKKECPPNFPERNGTKKKKGITVVIGARAP